MRILPALAAVAFLAASPCLAQGYGDNDGARREHRVEQREHTVRHDAGEPRHDAARGDDRDVTREQAEARQHEAAAQHHETRAYEEGPGGTRHDYDR